MNLIFFVGSLKCANYRERLIRRRRIGGRYVPRVPRLEDNGVRHFSFRSFPPTIVTTCGRNGTKALSLGLD